MRTENKENVNTEEIKQNALAENTDNTEAAENTENIDAAATDSDEEKTDIGAALAGETDEDVDLLKEMKRKAKEEKKALKQKLKEEKAEAAEEKKATKKKKADKSENPEDINIVKDLVSVLIYMLVIVVLCLLIVTFVGQRTTVNGDSMNPTLENGDNLWIDKFSYRFKDPQRYDIIVFPQQDVFYIKRVIGLPGETVRIDTEGNLYINGELVQDEYSQITIHNAGDVGGDGITLGEGEYFVMGDNRNNSHDSRDQNVVGNITKKRMIGKAVFRLTPFSKFGSIYK